MGFWIRNIIIAIILIGLAFAFFINQDLLLSLGDGPEQKAASTTTTVSNNKAETTAPTTAKLHYQQGRKANNAAAEGLSNFYAKIYGDGISTKGPRIRNNIIFLPEPQGNLIEILQKREVNTRPYKRSWHGTTTSRAFRKGETLYQKLAEYAEKDGLQTIWWLNRDFIIKDAFRINKNILKTTYQVGEAVAGHFPEGINSYFCYRQRTLVIINDAPEYLNEECSLLKPRSAY